MSQEFTTPIPQESRNSFGRRMVAIAALGVSIAGIAACGDDAPKSIDVPLGGSDTTVDASSTTVQSSEALSEVENLLNPSAEELALFNCSDPSLAKYGVVAVKINNESLIQQILPQRIPVESEARDIYHRTASDSLDTPFIEENSDKEAQEKELNARFCANPALLAGAVHAVTNTKIFDKELLGEHSKMLEQFVGMDKDDVSKFFTNPYNKEEITQEQQDKNLEATKTRQEYAALMAVILNGMQNNGVIKGMQLHSEYALSPDSILNPLEAAKFADADYFGDALTFHFSLKGKDCELFAFGFNAGAFNSNGGDKRPVIVIQQRVCETPTETTVPKGVTPTTAKRVNPTTSSSTPEEEPTSTRPEVAVPTQSSVIAGQGAGGSADADNNAANNVTTSNVAESSSSVQQEVTTTVTIADTTPKSSVSIP